MSEKFPIWMILLFTPAVLLVGLFIFNISPIVFCIFIGIILFIIIDYIMFRIWHSGCENNNQKKLI